MATMHGMQSNTHNCLNLHKYKHLLEIYLKINKKEKLVSI